MKTIISKEEFDELMRIKGEVRGLAFKTEAEFILKERGEEGLRKLENTMAKLGYPIKYRKTRSMDFYPIGLVAVTLLALKRLLNFDDKKFQEMGRFESKISLIIRLFMKYFVSLERAAKAVPEMWKKYYTVGELRAIEYDEKKKYGILRLENFRLHPFLCQVLKGYFSSVVAMIVGKEVICEETKCVFRGDKYHEFFLNW